MNEQIISQAEPEPAARPPLFPGPNRDRSEAFAELERSVRAALETYANVHRGSGHASLVSTALFEHARLVVLDHLGLEASRHTVIFCTAARASELLLALAPADCRTVSSHDIGLALGVTAVAIRTRSLRGLKPAQAGGGTVKIVSPRRVVWADVPGRFEAGTPTIPNIIAFAKGLQLTHKFGAGVFRGSESGPMTASAILRGGEFAGCSGRELLSRLRMTVVGRHARVPAASGELPLINLDNAASTPTLESIWDVVCRTWRHPEAHGALIREVKSICAGFLGAPPDAYDLIFTSNTTEAINIAARSLSRDHEPGVEPAVITTLLEHNSNELPWRSVSGVSVLRLEVDGEGFMDLNELERLLRTYNLEHRHGRRLVRIVAVSGASNVLGTFNDIESISKIVHRYGARVLVDAAQLVAHRRVSMASTGIDYLAFSGHKAYAPFGSGALVARKGLLRLEKWDLERINASGEENAAGLAALGKALLILEHVGLDVIEDEERRLTRQALQRLAKIPGVKVYGVNDPDSPRFARRGGIISFGLRGVPHNLAAQELAEQGGIGVRNGCFCAHLLVKRLLGIRPLRARAAELGLRLFPRFTAALMPGLLRISLGLFNEVRDIDALGGVLERILRRPRGLFSRLLASLHNGAPVLPQTKMRTKMDSFVAASVRRVYGHDDHFVPHVAPAPFGQNSRPACTAGHVFPFKRGCCGLNPARTR